MWSGPAWRSTSASRPTPPCAENVNGRRAEPVDAPTTVNGPEVTRALVHRHARAIRDRQDPALIVTPDRELVVRLDLVRLRERLALVAEPLVEERVRAGAAQARDPQVGVLVELG